MTAGLRQAARAFGAPCWRSAAWSWRSSTALTSWNDTGAWDGDGATASTASTPDAAVGMATVRVKGWSGSWKGGGRNSVERRGEGVLGVITGRWWREQHI
jgi:hypothetical protein